MLVNVWKSLIHVLLIRNNTEQMHAAEAELHKDCKKKQGSLAS